jgi:hypothetical protein
MPEIEIKVKGFKCERCGHVWIPRSRKIIPVTCPNPNCKSPYWDRPHIYKRVRGTDDTEFKLTSRKGKK